MKYPVSRFFRVLFSVVFCTAAALMLAFLLWPLSAGHYTHQAAAALFIIAFGFPFLGGFIVIMTGILYWFDRWRCGKPAWGFKRLLAIVIVSALFSSVGFFDVYAGAFFLFVSLYWIMTGRIAGRPGWSIKHFWRTRLDEKLYLVGVVALVAPIVGWSLSYALYSVLPERPGTPAFQVQYQHQMSPDIVRAMRVFPNVESCLVRGADPTKHEDLSRMDWDEISTTGEAQVCVFRLLHEWGGVADAQLWLEQQGFHVSSMNNSVLPYVAPNGTTRVDAGWSIRENGPRYPTSGVIRRIMWAVPHRMTVNATFNANGSELLYVNIGFSTL